jgi:hypothetical protein
MGKSKYRTVVAAVLAGVVLFSPLLCGRTCFGVRGVRPDVAPEAVAPAAELAGEFAVSGVVGCVLTRVILNIDGSEWMDVLKVASWVGIGAEAEELVRGVLREELRWM